MRNSKPELCGSPDPRDGHVARAVADEGDDLAGDRSELLLKGENVRQHLARMLVIGQGVDGGNAGVLREFLDITLGKRADDRAVNHAPEHAGRVLDRFTASELYVIRIEKQHFSAEFAEPNFEGNAGASGRFAEHQRPGLAGQRLAVGFAVALELRRVAQHHFHVAPRHFLKTEQMLHNKVRAHPRDNGKNPELHLGKPVN
jgi:hypothetical protein